MKQLIKSIMVRFGYVDRDKFREIAKAELVEYMSQHYIQEKINREIDYKINSNQAYCKLQRTVLDEFRSEAKTILNREDILDDLVKRLQAKQLNL